MARAVDGDLLVDYIRKIDMPFETKITVICTVNTMPTIDPVKHGKWIDRMCRDWRCSECGGEICKFRHVDGYTRDDKPKYCPNCGARMDGE